jgi:hypothetical protein
VSQRWTEIAVNQDLIVEVLLERFDRVIDLAAAKAIEHGYCLESIERGVMVVALHCTQEVGDPSHPDQ